MEIFQMMIDYFSLSAISEAETFPDLLQAFIYTLLALYLIVFIFRAFFTATWKIRQDLMARR